MHVCGKARPEATVRAAVPDPDGLLEWKSADRANLTVRDADDAGRKTSALTEITRAWTLPLGDPLRVARSG